MPASERSIAVTDRYRQQLLELRGLVAIDVAERWQHVNLDDLEGSFAVWSANTVAILTAAQRRGVIVSAAYLAAFMASELNREPDAPVRSDEAAELPGRGRDSRQIGRAHV